MSVEKGTVPITGYIAPTDINDTYPTHKDNYGKGGIHSVADIATRNLISRDRRREGMQAYIKETKETYQLIGGIENVNWVLLYQITDGENPGIDFSIDCPQGYIIEGDQFRKGVPSPVLIDVRLDLIQVRNSDLIMGTRNHRMPGAQVLAEIDNGFIYNTKGKVSTKSISNKDLTLPQYNLFIGDENANPTPQLKFKFRNMQELYLSVPSITSVTNAGSYFSSLFDAFTGDGFPDLANKALYLKNKIGRGDYFGLLGDITDLIDTASNSGFTSLITGLFKTKNSLLQGQIYRASQLGNGDIVASNDLSILEDRMDKVEIDTGDFNNEVNEKIDNITEEINNLTEQIETINDYLEQINQYLKEFSDVVQQNFNDVNNKIDTINDYLTKLDQYLSQLENYLESNFQSINQQISNLASSVLTEFGSVYTQLGSLYAGIEGAFAGIAALGGIVGGLSGAFSNLVSNYDNLVNKVDTIDQQLNQLTQTVSNQSEQISNLTNITDNQAINIDNLTSLVTAQGFAIIDLFNQIGNLSSSLNSQISNINNSISTITNQITNINNFINNLTLNNLPVVGALDMHNNSIINVQSDVTNSTSAATNGDVVTIATPIAVAAAAAAAGAAIQTLHIDGTVTGGPPDSTGTINVSIQKDVSFNNFRAANIAQNPEDDLDAVSRLFLLDLLQDNVDIIWQT